ncbi:galactan beta-1,4-galactosyltransferase GALS1 [Cheilinus undulatus]|uniref:galactan beta-1,4-galactosyltransferase GALS1 n=1 Tax=Cheilinus undulatus TaxID=241271 RepID=UPI001BD24058|nr:galactan beta-1,4-galactosyltransferase GALS1 [Cheilinus undulatus]
MGQKFLEVKSTKTLLLSAYQEHRSKYKEVRVIAVVLREEKAAYRCLLCCQDHLHQSLGYQRIHDDHFGFPYGAADIMCPVPSGCDTVSHIAVISHTAKETGVKEFLEVKNQKAKSDSFQFNFTVCFSTMFDFTNLLQLVQSVEMLQLLGVNRIVIYKTSHSPEIKHLLDYYTQKGVVEVIPWLMTKYLNVSRSWRPDLSPGDIQYFGQIPALNDCVYRYMYESRYVALHDVDELILPQSVNSWSELLPQLEEKYGKDKCYLFENHVFPNNILLPSPTSQTLPPQSRWNKVPGLNILAYLYRETYVQQSNRKFIVNPRVVFETSVHSLLRPWGIWKKVDKGIARMYHTRSSTQPHLVDTPGQLIYDARLLSYSSNLTSAVNTVLRESGLLPEGSII